MKPNEEKLIKELKALYGIGFLASTLGKELEDGEPMLENAVQVTLKAILKAERQRLREQIEKLQAKKILGRYPGKTVDVLAWNAALDEVLALLSDEAETKP